VASRINVVRLSLYDLRRQAQSTDARIIVNHIRHKLTYYDDANLTDYDGTRTAMKSDRPGGHIRRSVLKRAVLFAIEAQYAHVSEIVAEAQRQRAEVEAHSRGRNRAFNAMTDTLAALKARMLSDAKCP